MSRVIVKLWPEKSDEPKRRLFDTITRGDRQARSDKDALSVSFEEVAPSNWTAQVYYPGMLSKSPMAVPHHRKNEASEAAKERT